MILRLVEIEAASGGLFSSPPLAENLALVVLERPAVAACDQRVNTYDWSIGSTADIDGGAALMVVQQALALTGGRGTRELRRKPCFDRVWSRARAWR